MKNGIYFGIPDEDYHAIPALSASGIKNLLISPMEFWANSWMNPDKEESDSSAMVAGKAYHKRILEGKDAFWGAYCRAFDKKEHEALDSADDMKEVLKEMNLSQSGTKAAMRSRLLDNGFKGLFMDDLAKAYEDENKGKTPLPDKLIKQIEIAAYMIGKDPAAVSCFKGGYPEVTIIWTANGVPMKARFDYLKTKAVCDLKTFSNPQGKSIYNALGAAMASRKYHIQAAVYLEADRQARKFAAQGKVFGEPEPEWIKAYADYKDEAGFFFVFQQTGHAPITRVREFSTVLETYKIGVVAMQQAIQKYSEFSKAFGEDPWLDIEELGQFEDNQFPLYMLEI